MEISYVYTKLRREFGRPAIFSDRPAELMLDLHPDPNLAAKYSHKTHKDVASQAGPTMSEHQVKYF